MKTAIRFVCIFMLSVLLFSGCTCGKVGVEQLNVTTEPAYTADTSYSPDSEYEISWENVEDRQTLHMLSAYCAGHTGYETLFTEEEARLYLLECGLFNTPYSCFTENGTALILHEYDYDHGTAYYYGYRTSDFGRNWEVTDPDIHFPSPLKEITYVNGSFWAYGFSMYDIQFYAAQFADDMTKIRKSYSSEASEDGYSLFEESGYFWESRSFFYDANREMYALEAAKYDNDDYVAYYDAEYNGAEPDVNPVETLYLWFTEKGGYCEYTTAERWEPAEDRELRFLKAVSAGHAGYDTPFSADAAAVYLTDFDNDEKYRYESVKQCFTPEGCAIVMRSVCSGAGQRYYRIDRTFDYGKTWEVNSRESNFAGDVCAIFPFKDAFWACGCSSAGESFFVVRVGNGPREQVVQTFTAGRYITSGWDVKTLQYDAQSGLYELVLCRTGEDGEESVTATERFTPEGCRAKN